jgi:hypothetical protein
LALSQQPASTDDHGKETSWMLSPSNCRWLKPKLTPVSNHRRQVNGELCSWVPPELLSPKSEHNKMVLR